MGISYDFVTKKWRSNYDSSVISEAFWGTHTEYPKFPYMKDLVTRNTENNCHWLQSTTDFSNNFQSVIFLGHTVCQENTSHYLGWKYLHRRLHLDQKILRIVSKDSISKDSI